MRSHSELQRGHSAFLSSYAPEDEGLYDDCAARRQLAMDEAEFWGALEYRLCREFQGLAEPRYRYLSCDGFAPGRYLLEDAVPRIAGLVWIFNPDQEEWEFELFLPHPVAGRDQIDWAALLPPENMTKWLAIDVPNRRIQIDPASAVRDLA